MSTKFLHCSKKSLIFTDDPRRTTNRTSPIVSMLSFTKYFGFRIARNETLALAKFRMITHQRK